MPYQLHILREHKLVAKAYVWLGGGEPEWAHTRENPPALTSEERINSSHAEKSAMVREALEDGGVRAAQFRRGMVDGVHYLELVEPIKQLKREGRLEEALVLCYKAIKGAEGDAGDSIPAPWYTEQAAIVHRKLRQRDEEIAVLKRWLTRCPKTLRAGTGIVTGFAVGAGAGTGEHQEGLLGAHFEAFHQDAFCLADELTGHQGFVELADFLGVAESRGRVSGDEQPNLLGLRRRTGLRACCAPPAQRRHCRTPANGSRC